MPYQPCGLLSAPHGRASQMSCVLLLLFVLATPPAKSFQAAKCWETYELASVEVDNVTCPSQCNYAHTCGVASTVQCISATKCDSVHGDSLHAVQDGKVCLACRVEGCTTCSTETSCEVCESGYDLSDGLCSWTNWTFWYVLSSVAFIICVWGVVDFLRAHLRSESNRAAVNKGLRFRSRTKVRNRDTAGRAMYPLLTNMHIKPIVGPGVSLFMNWFFLVGLLAIWLFVLSLIFMPEDHTAKVLENWCRTYYPPGEVYDKTKRWGLNLSEDNMPLLTGLAYGGALIMSVVFFKIQHLMWVQINKDDSIAPVLRYYALEAHGFPADAVDQEELRQYWANALQDLGYYQDLESSAKAIVEVSVAYDFHARADVVWAAIDDEFDAMQTHHSRDLTPPAEDKLSEEKHAGTFWVQTLAFVMLGTDFDLCGVKLRGYAPSLPQMDDEEVAKLLEETMCSGIVICVFRSSHDVQKLIERGTMRLKFRDVNEVSVRDVLEEPLGVQWENFGIPPEEHKKKAVIMTIILLCTLVAWTLLYWPWSTFTMQSLGAAENIATIVGLGLGLFISLGNAMVGYVVSGLATYYGFRYESKMRWCYLIIIVPCVFINCAADVYITLLSSVTKLNGKYGTEIDPNSLQGMYLAMDDLFLALVPAYVFLPYFFEPMVTVLVPYWVGIWRIKCDTRISIHDAENLLKAPEIDIVNPPYCDIICCTSTFILTFLAPSKTHWHFFLALIFFAVFLYCQNRVRILRWQSSSYFGTKDLDVLEKYLWSLPLGLLAASFAVHSASIWTSTWQVTIGFGAFFAHVAVHCAALHYTHEPPPNVVDELYDDALARHHIAATYRNTNPIEVLKSRQNIEDMLVFYREGKEHLQPGSDGRYDGDDQVRSYTNIVPTGITASAKSIPAQVANAIASPVKKVAKSNQVTPARDED